MYEEFETEFETEIETETQKAFREFAVAKAQLVAALLATGLGKFVWWCLEKLSWLVNKWNT